MKVQKICLGALLSALSFSAFAGGGGGGMIVFDPTNYAKNIESAISEAESAKNSLDQLTLAKRNFERFSDFQWNSAAQDLQSLAGAIRTGNAIAYNMSNINNEFQQRFPGYKPTQNYSHDYQSWSSTAMDTIRGTLNSVGLQAQQFSDEASTIETLKSMANNATSQTKAVQVGSMISAETVNSLQKLRQIQMSQMNAQNAYMAYQVQKDQARQGQVDSLVNNINTNYPKYKDQGFGKIPSF